MSYEFYPATVGNDISCSIHGFLMQFLDTASVVYNGCLSIYYLLVIKYRWSDRKLKKLEKWFHIIPWSFGIVTAIIPAALKLYNLAGWNCWVSTDYKDPDDPRKDLILAIQLAIFYVPLWVTIILSGGCMFMIYQYVRETELRTAGSSVVSSRLARTKQVAFQGVYFVAALVVTWCIPSIVRVISMTGGTAPRALIVLGGITAPSQGFLNAFAYFRIRATRQMRENLNTPKWRIVAGIIRAQLFPLWKPAGSLEDNGNDCEAKIDDNDSSRPDVEIGASKPPAGRRATPCRSAPLSVGSDWKSLRSQGVNTIDSKRVLISARSSDLESSSPPRMHTISKRDSVISELSANSTDFQHKSSKLELETLNKGGVHEEDLPPNRSPTSESQGQSIFPIKTLDGGGVGEDVSKTMQNEDAINKEDDRNGLD